MAIEPRGVSMPDWKIKIFELKNRDSNTIKDYEKQFKFGPTEVGMRNRQTKSHLKIYDNGNIDLFAGDITGLRIDDFLDTIVLYGNKVAMDTQIVKLKTLPNGLIWNDYYMNPQLYQLDDEDFLLEGSVKYFVEETEDVPAHWDRKSVSVKPFIKVRKDYEYSALLSELNIPE